MKPTLKFDRTLVTVLVDEVVHVLLELVAPPAAPVRRPPLDVVVALDRSGSMSGAPLAAVTSATAQLLRLAGPDDRIGVVAFDEYVQMVLPLAQHDPEAAAAAVLALQAGGTTNLSGGWLKALEMLAGKRRPDALRRVILLTDGHANVGITEPDELVTFVRGAGAQGVSTSCIGFADGYDEHLLAALADAGHGNDYWCDGPDQAAKVFADEFGGLASVVAQNVSVEIVPSLRVAAAAVLNEFPITEVPGGLQVAMGDAYGSEHRKLVAKFHLRPAQAPGPIDVADLVIRWAAVLGDVALHTVTVPVVVTAGDGDAPDPGADTGVREEVLRLEVARNRREAGDAARRGDFLAASSLLRAGAVLMSALPGERDLVEELTRDADALAAQMWTEADAKRTFSRARGTSRGRRTDYTAAGPDPAPDAGPGPAPDGPDA